MMITAWRKLVFSSLLVVSATGVSAEDDGRVTKVHRIDGRNLHYQDEGPGSPILILHGAAPIMPESWDKTIKAMVEAGYRVVFPQRAGRGKSDPHPEFLSLSRDARDMWSLADHLKLGRVVLLAHSQGASIAREMLLKRPDRVAAVVSEDSGTFGKLTSAAARAGIDRLDIDDRMLHTKNEATLAALGRPWDYPSDYNVSYLLKRQRGNRPSDDWKTQHVPDPNDAPAPKNELWCHVPLLAFTAGRGRIRQEDAETNALLKTLPAKDCRLVVVTKSGHCIHGEQAEIFNRELIRFLKKQVEPGSS